MARENLVSALIARWVMSMFSRSRKFMRFSLLTISSVFTFGITPPCQCGVHHFCHGCSFVGFMECRACKSCSGFGTDYTSSKPPKTPCYVMLSPSLLSVPRAFFLVSNYNFRKILHFSSSSSINVCTCLLFLLLFFYFSLNDFLF